MDGQPLSTGWPPNSHGWSVTLQNLTEGIVYMLGRWQLDWTNKIKTSHHHQVCHPPSKGWLPAIQNLTEGSVLQTWNLAHKLIHKIKTRRQLPWLVSYHPLEGHPPSQGHGWLPCIPGRVTYQPYVGHPFSKIPSQILLPSFPRMVIHDPKHGNPPSKITKIW